MARSDFVSILSSLVESVVRVLYVGVVIYGLMWLLMYLYVRFDLTWGLAGAGLSRDVTLAMAWAGLMLFKLSLLWLAMLGLLLWLWKKGRENAAAGNLE